MKTITYDETKYVLVPVEPTPEMLAALWAYKSDSLQDCYRAMLSAAPQPEDMPAIFKEQAS